MVVKNVTQVGNPIIRKKSKAVPLKDIGSAKVRKIITDLVDSMRYHNLVGMAAPQIGHNVRIFVSEIRDTKVRKVTETDELRVYINPIIKGNNDEQNLGYEGCGSVAEGGLFAKVWRWNRVQVYGYDDLGNPNRLDASDLLARIVQHEIDHLNGLVFLDQDFARQTLMSRNEYRKKLINKHP